MAIVSELVAAHGHEPGLEPLRRAEHEDLGVGLALAQAVGDGEQRIDVAGGAAAGEQVRGHRAERPDRAAARATARASHARPPRGRGEGEHDADGDEGREQRGATRRDERQRNAEDREQTPSTTAMLTNAWPMIHTMRRRGGDLRERVVLAARMIRTKRDGEHHEQREHDDARRSARAPRR